MDIASIPPTVFVALGVITAALLTGFFSFMNMVSAKENKVSEFRLSWVDGLRNEIAEYTSAVQELVRVTNRFNAEDHHTDKERHSLKIEWYKETREAFSRAIESLSKIQLRLNPEHIKNHPDSPEAKLMNAIASARNASKAGDFNGALNHCTDIREAASPILKNTWDLVKRGEIGYQKTRKYALYTIVGGFYMIFTVGMAIGISTLISNQEQIMREIIQKIKSDSEENPNLSKKQTEHISPGTP
ncbi:hypothetical protein [Pseudomonas sp. GZD-222]|uniref:hypothetical protein n=1 Tax=Pseudomonas sp. GZD-222 TaxID=3404805 RepID=UPI003BB6F4A9